MIGSDSYNDADFYCNFIILFWIHDDTIYIFLGFKVVYI